MSEHVDHPAHYKARKHECFEVMQDVFGEEATKAFCKLNAFKYLWRAEHKGRKEDIEKAVWYLNWYLYIERGETK